jgi:hypothetical protein
MPSLDTILNITIPAGTGMLIGYLLFITQRTNTALLKHLEQLIKLIEENHKHMQLKPRAIIHVRVRKKRSPPEQQAPNATETQG